MQYFESRDYQFPSILLGTPKLFHQPLICAPRNLANHHSMTSLEEFPFYTHGLNNPEPYRCRFLKTFYRELGTRDPPHLPPWASPLPLGTLCPAHFQPHLQLVHKSEQEHRLENIKPDQIFAPVRVSVIKIQ